MEEAKMVSVDTELAVTLMEMAEACLYEDVGPNYTSVIEFVKEHFPEIASKYPHLYVEPEISAPINKTTHAIDPGCDSPPVLAYPELFVYSEESKKYYQATESLYTVLPDGTKSIKGKIVNVRDTITSVFIFDNGEILDSRTINPISILEGDTLNIDRTIKVDEEALK